MATLVVLMPFLGVGMWYLGSLWSMYAAVPPFLQPIVMGMSFILVCMALAAIVGLLLVFLTVCGITLDAQRARLARNALPERVRSRRSWQALATTVRLASLRAAAGPGPRQASQRSKNAAHEWSWNDAWQKAAGARKRRKEDVAQDKLDIGGFILRGASPVVVCVCWATLAFENYVFFFLALPYFELNRYCHVLVLIPTVYVGFMIYFHYAQTLLSSPGHPAPCGEAACAEVEGLPAPAEAEGKAKWCTHCNAWKPPRCHHCRICRRCVLKMDHHCMFVNNCVGRDNYRHFVLLLFYIVFALIVFGLCLIPQVLGIFGDQRESAFQRSLVLVGFAIAVLATVMLGPFFWYHSQCVLRNETTLERMKRDQVESPLKRGKFNSKAEPAEALVSYSRSPLENYSEVFGMPPVWSRAAIECAFGLLTSRRCAKRSA